MKLEYEDSELTIYDDKHQLGSNECLNIWQTDKGFIAFMLGNEYKLNEEDDGYGNKIYVIIHK